jgi:hypothetical protein
MSPIGLSSVCVYPKVGVTGQILTAVVISTWIMYPNVLFATLYKLLNMCLISLCQNLIVNTVLSV